MPNKIIDTSSCSIQQNQNEDEESSDDDESDLEEEESQSKSQRSSTKFVPTLANFASWYANQYGNDERPPLVIIFEDFEGFGSQMLQDLIANLQ